MLTIPFKIDMIIDNLLLLLKEEMYALGCVSAHQDWHQTSHLPMLSPHTHTHNQWHSMCNNSNLVHKMKAVGSIKQPTIENWKVAKVAKSMNLANVHLSWKKPLWLLIISERQIFSEKGRVCKLWEEVNIYSGWNAFLKRKRDLLDLEFWSWRKSGGIREPPATGALQVW